MKIEKGKLYYDTIIGKCFVSDKTSEFLINEYFINNKIAVYCKSEEDKYYVCDKYNIKEKEPYITLNGEGSFWEGYFLKDNYHIITIDQFKEFYPESMNNQELGIKESNNKLAYELDFNFITQLAERMQTNKGKYDPYNWKKPIELEQLKQSLLRHVIELMNNNYSDDGREYGHIEAIACNAMMINYQLKNNK